MCFCGVWRKKIVFAVLAGTCVFAVWRENAFLRFWLGNAFCGFSGKCVFPVLAGNAVFQFWRENAFFAVLCFGGKMHFYSLDGKLGDLSGCNIIMYNTNIDLHLHPDGSPG
uniref:Uncharacterized protein n=1 Tax=Brassica oleracea var. oleracea TaxID=109376 RepID=A0A0D3DMU4_BRAOL